MAIFNKTSGQKGIQKVYLISFSIFLFIILYLILKSPNSQKIWTPENSLKKVAIKKLIDNIDNDQLVLALNNSISYYKNLQPSDIEQTIQMDQDNYSLRDILNSLTDFKEKFLKLGFSKNFYTYLTRNYQFYKPNKSKKVLFTGYYEALLEGSLFQIPPYNYPLYQTPKDLVRIKLSEYFFYSAELMLPPLLRGRIVENKVIPYYSRKDIDQDQVLLNSDLAFVWLKDPIKRFFLHIQGSGIIRLREGELMRVNYADSNGHPYRPIGKYLIDQGFLNKEEVTMQSISNFLIKNPNKLNKIFHYNPSYVFFRVVKEGPIGSMGFPVIPLRTIATDNSLFPEGILCYINISIPTFNDQDEKNGEIKFSGFLLNQDTGGAIRSPFRADLFCGNGKLAELIAGHIKTGGDLFFLLKKNK